MLPDSYVCSNVCSYVLQNLYECLYVRSYVLKNLYICSCVRLYVLKNLYGRLYVLPNLYVNKGLYYTTLSYTTDTILSYLGTTEYAGLNHSAE